MAVGPSPAVVAVAPNSASLVFTFARPEAEWLVASVKAEIARTQDIAPEALINDYRQALEMFPANAIRDLAPTHNQLGNVYGDAGQIELAGLALTGGLVSGVLSAIVTGILAIQSTFRFAEKSAFQQRIANDAGGSLSYEAS